MLAVVSLVLPIVSVVQSRFVTVPDAAVRTVAETAEAETVPETMLPSKPLLDRTGPEKVVLAIENHLMHKSPTRLCIVR